jgi:hypothetical protein
MFNLSGITLKFHVVTVFVIVDIHTTFHIKFVDMLVLYFFSKFSTPVSNGSLVIAIKPKLNLYLLIPSCCFTFYKTLSTKVVYFSTQNFRTTSSGTSVASMS